MKLAIIPARGGSKRILRKNIKEFCGKPIIAWSIEAAKISGCFDRIVVSTDDAEIADVARRYGAEIPFMRPAELSDDYVGTIPVIAHAISQCVGQEDPVAVCCIYPAAPLIQAADLQRGFSLLMEHRSDYVVPVTRYGFPIQRAIHITDAGRMAMFSPEHFGTRSQDLVEAYHDAGQFYWGRASAWLNQHALFGEQSLPLILPRHRVQDIDTLEDWHRAELLFQLMGTSSNTS